MARNQVQFQKGLSEARFGETYGTEEQCHAALVKWRWPNGFECPGCNGADHCVVTRDARRLFQCNACRKQTSVKAGTIFASSKLPLHIWFKTIYLVTQSKKGIQYRARPTTRRHPNGGLDDEAQTRASDAGAQREQTLERQRPDGRRLYRRRPFRPPRPRRNRQDAVRRCGCDNR